jgi:hypothetical protein
MVTFLYELKQKVMFIFCRYKFQFEDSPKVKIEEDQRRKFQKGPERGLKKISHESWTSYKTTEAEDSRGQRFNVKITSIC